MDEWEKKAEENEDDWRDEEIERIGFFDAGTRL